MEKSNLGLDVSLKSVYRLYKVFRAELRSFDWTKKNSRLRPLVCDVSLKILILPSRPYTTYKPTLNCYIESNGLLVLCKEKKSKTHIKNVTMTVSKNKETIFFLMS